MSILKLIKIKLKLVANKLRISKLSSVSPQARRGDEENNRNSRRGRKRARSSRLPNHLFEICSSSDSND